MVDVCKMAAAELKKFPPIVKLSLKQLGGEVERCQHMCRGSTQPAFNISPFQACPIQVPHLQFAISATFR